MVDVLFLPSVLLFISSGEDIPFSAYIRRKIGTLLDHLICGPFAQILFHKNIFRLSLGADKPAEYGGCLLSLFSPLSHWFLRPPVEGTKKHDKSRGFPTPSQVVGLVGA